MAEENARTEEPDMSWVDIAVCGPGHCVVIVDCAPGLFEFIDELFFEDNFAIDAPMHLAPGLYRWSGFNLGMWDEGDAINASGGEFTALATRAENAGVGAPPPSTTAGEVARIVAYLRQQSELGADKGLAAEQGSTKRAAFGGGSLILKRAADAIESGEYCAPAPGEGS